MLRTFCANFGSQKFSSKVSAGHVWAKGCRRTSFIAFPTHGAPGAPWLVLQPVPLWPHGFLSTIQLGTQKNTKCAGTGTTWVIEMTTSINPWLHHIWIVPETHRWQQNCSYITWNGICPILVGELSNDVTILLSLFWLAMFDSDTWCTSDHTLADISSLCVGKFIYHLKIPMVSIRCLTKGLKVTPFGKNRWFGHVLCLWCGFELF